MDSVNSSDPYGSCAHLKALARSWRLWEISINSMEHHCIVLSWDVLYSACTRRLVLKSDGMRVYVKSFSLEYIEHPRILDVFPIRSQVEYLTSRLKSLRKLYIWLYCFLSYIDEPGTFSHWLQACRMTRAHNGKFFIWIYNVR